MLDNQPYANKTIRDAYQCFSNSLAERYRQLLIPWIRESKLFIPFTLHVTPINPKLHSVHTIEDLRTTLERTFNHTPAADSLDETLNCFYDRIQTSLRFSSNKKRTPQGIRPIIFSFDDIPGSKGSGKDARYRIYTNNGNRYENLHSHAIILLHRDTVDRFNPLNFRRQGLFDLEIDELALERIENYVNYITKLVGKSNAIDLSFVNVRVFHSYVRETMGPDQLIEHLANWQATYWDAN